MWFVSALSKSVFHDFVNKMVLTLTSLTKPKLVAERFFRGSGFMRNYDVDKEL